MTYPQHEIDDSSGAAPESQPEYAQVPSMRPYDPIPPASNDAVEWATQAYEGIRQSSPETVDEFENKFEAWRIEWDSPQFMLSASARERCNVDEYEGLLDMGPKILPLVVYKLLQRDNFTAVFLYNDLEENPKNKVDPHDVLNFLVLQRQSNLIVDINCGREW